MNKEVLELIERKKELEKELNEADEKGNIGRCFVLDNTIESICRQIKNIATEEELLELHSQGLIGLY